MQWNRVKFSKSIKDVKTALRELPREFSEVYAKTVTRISEQERSDAEYGTRIIRWLTHTRRVLKLDELQHALAVEVGNYGRMLDGDDEIEDSDVYDRTALIEENIMTTVTMGLIRVGGDRSVRLMHRSAYEYFKEADDEKNLREAANVELALTCMAYLSCTPAKTPCVGQNDDLQIAEKLKDSPFAAYASQHWGRHAARSQHTATVQTAIEALTALPGAVDSAVQISAFHETQEPSGWNVRKGVTSLHVLSWFGLHSVMDETAFSPDMVNSQDSSIHGRTPLIYACIGADRETSARLLRLGASVRIRDRHGTSPLGHAIASGNEEAVGLLLDTPDLDMRSSVDADGRSALILAMHNPRAPIVKMLISQQSIDLNQKGPRGLTALMHAASGDAIHVLRRLLKQPSIDVNMRDDMGCTALHHAAANNKSENVRELLDHGADASAGSGTTGTALLFAIERGLRDVAKEFFRRFDENSFSHETTCDERNEGLLHCAVRSGVVDVVEWLLEHGFNVNVQDIHGTSPLHIACQSNMLLAVDKLLENGANPALSNERGETATDVAHLHNFPEIVARLQGSSVREAERSVPSELPTWIMASRGLNDELKSLIVKNASRLLETDFDGNTALHMAVRKKDLACIRMILSCSKGLDVTNTQNRLGQTPLHEACLVDADLLVRLLMEHDPPADVNLHNATNETALEIVIQRSNTLSMVTLIEAGAELDRADRIPDLVFEAAVESNSLRAVERLIGIGMEVKDHYRYLARKTDASAELQQLLSNSKTWKTDKSDSVADAVASDTPPSPQRLDILNSDATLPTHGHATIVEDFEDTNQAPQRIRKPITSVSAISADDPLTEEVITTTQSPHVADRILDPLDLPAVPVPDGRFAIEMAKEISLPSVPTTMPEPLPSLSVLRAAFDELQSQAERETRHGAELLESPLLVQP